MNIKECYCGSPVSTMYQLLGWKMLWFVSCPQCRIRTRYFDTEEEAIAEWNARPEVPVKKVVRTKCPVCLGKGSVNGFATIGGNYEEYYTHTCGRCKGRGIIEEEI